MTKITFQKYTQNMLDAWNDVLQKSESGSFIATLEWIEFQNKLGKTIDQYLILADGQAIGTLYIEIYKRKISKYAYSPYGPVIINPEKYSDDIFKALHDFAKKYIADNKLNLFRIDPILPKKHLQNLLNLGFKASLAPGQAKDTIEVNLGESEEILKKNMSESTRHNVNKGMRSEVRIVKAKTESEVKAFSDLMMETTMRKGFSNFDVTYFVKQFKELNNKGLCDLYLAQYQDKFIAGAWVNYFKDKAYYTHGCSTSDRELAKLRSPYLLQWMVMKDLKEKGLKAYNMWGILPASVANAPLKGVSDFKRSLGGKEINYVGTVEVSAGGVGYLIQRVVEWWAYKNDRY